RGAGPIEELQQLRPARSDEPGDADYLTLPDGERDAVDLGTREIPRLEQDSARFASWCEPRLINATADHLLDDAVDGGLVDVVGGDHQPVSHDRDPVAELEDLLEAMG